MRGRGSGPRLVSRTSQGPIWFKLMTRRPRHEASRRQQPPLGLAARFLTTALMGNANRNLARRLCSSGAGLMMRARGAAQFFRTHWRFPDPERSGEILPIPKLGAESADRYLLFHELAGNDLTNQGDAVMKTITSALVALVLLTGITASAQALDARSFYEQVDRNHN
jgi:hypothetical protein